MKVYTINPYTEEKIKGYDLFSKKKLDSTLNNSKIGFEKWKEYNVRDRSFLIKDVGKALLNRKREYAKLITIEMGKPIKESLAEIEKCAWLCDYYSKNAEEFLKEEKVKTEHKHSYVRFDPLGKILCVMPWNFPFWQVMRFSIPALCAGNSIILKHSSITLGCSLEIERLFNEILGKNVFQTVITNENGVEYIMNGVNGVSLTGSVETGKKVAENSGKRLKKIVLELGGSDPFIVLKDADLKFTCEQGIKGRFINSGQSCIAAKRFIVVKERFEEFNNIIISLVEKLNVGDPMKYSTDIGPLARKVFLLNLDKQVKYSVRQGAKILSGGNILRGNFYRPTVLVARNNMRDVKEETFGPVFTTIKVNNKREAVMEANNSEFGLGASIWTRDINKAMKYVKDIEAGFVSVNNIVKSDPRLPFGGIKNSGYGRELSRYGILEFCNIKSVVVD